ncbi:Kinesin-like protein KIF20B [Dissostichus eleginoides]|uniref:Kinesin-like protein KIF20B n=1 Tax=Dissostichus eleginoides TaxID=100907 RepID=A0AAD9EUL6_DISEL|nr:Kinesin-like protein KIF20B [Dissostichus eleginoides]
MMESCFGGKPEREGPVVVDDIKRDLLEDFIKKQKLYLIKALCLQEVVQTENLQVFLRECVSIEGPDTVVLRAPRTCQSKSLPQTAQRFTFTQVFDPEASQRKVFEGSVRGLVRDVLIGGNCLVFTYGVTNAGKTFTFLGPEHDSGLLPRSLSVIFNSIEGRVYPRSDLKPQRCRDFTRLTTEQQAAESSSKRSLLRLLKESDRSQTSGRSTFLDGSSLSTDSSVSEDSFCLDVDSNVRFSVWVPSGQQRRTALRLSQDVKGNSFIKDLRWVQASSSEEAYRVMKIGRKNQSFSSTRLNSLSSRSHSIFSIRILRIEDARVPRILGISELSLCDLAGSERCSRTQNSGERLKEAGNINTSLLTLGKCISAMRVNQHANAMRVNQHAKIQHHVPFRESKLTHFLQFFFCGAGRVSMVVNISRNSACFDETLNVLKFSALAQKVVLLSSRPLPVDGAPHRSALEVSLIMDEAEQRRTKRKSSMGDGEAALRLLLEAQIREEVSSEFMELYNTMKKDYRALNVPQRALNVPQRALDVPQRALNVRQRALNVPQRALDRALNVPQRALNVPQRALNVPQRALNVPQRALDVPQRALNVPQRALNQKVQELTDLDSCANCDSVFFSLEAEQRESGRLKKENKALINGIFNLQTEVTSLQTKLKEQTDSQSEELNTAKARLQDLESQSEEKAVSYNSLTQEVEHLRQEAKEEEPSRRFVSALQDLKEESQAALQRSAEKSQLIQDLQEERSQLQEERSQLQEERSQLQEERNLLQEERSQLQRRLDHSENRCAELSEELSNQRAAFSQQLQGLRAELESERGALRGRLQKEEQERAELLRAALEKEKLLEECRRETETLRKELERLKEELQSREEEEEEESRQEVMLVVQELKEELQSREEEEGEEESRQEVMLVVQELKEELQSREEEDRQEVMPVVQELKEELQSREEEEEEEEKENRQEVMPVVQELKEELQKLKERREEREEKERRKREEREFDAVRREMERLQRLKEERGGAQLGGSSITAGCESPCSWEEAASLQDLGGSSITAGCESPCSWEEAASLGCESPRSWEEAASLQDNLVSSENKRNRGRGNTRTNKQEKCDGALQKIGDLIHSSPSILGSTEHHGLVSGHSVEKEAVQRPKRGRRKLFKMDATLQDSPDAMSGRANEEKESDHLIIKRQLRSKTCRK